MYNINPLNYDMIRQRNEALDKIEDKIKEVKQSGKADKYRLLKLEEAKLYAGLFSNSYSQYRQPW